jgi:peptide/nickel transport system substrate-binding protein
MTKSSRWFATLTAIGAVALAVSGCTSTESSGPTTSSAIAFDGKQIPSAVFSLPAQTSSFDPTVTISATDRVVDSLLNTSLYIPKKDGTVEPGLAEGPAVFNNDLTVATVTMKSAKFSDGTAITANDVVETINRAKSVEGSVLDSTTSLISGVEALDDATVQFTFTKPNPSFEAIVGTLAVYPAGAMADAEAYFAKPTVTSGQYTIKNNWASNRLELQANPNYWGGEPAVEQVTFTVIPDGNSALSQLQSGQVDYVGDLAPSFIKQVTAGNGTRVEVSDVYGFFDVRLQNEHAPFDDVNVRKAVSAAIDRSAIVSSIWGEYNTPQAGFWPKGMDGHDPSKNVEQDLDAAKELLTGTACEDGCTVNMIYSDQDFAFAGQLALMLQQQLAEIGITVKLEQLDGATIVDRLFAGDFDLAPGAMASIGNTPDQLLNLAALGTGPLNAEFTGYNSEEMNQLVAAVNTTIGDERKENLAALEEVFSKDQHLVTLAPWVRGSVTTLPEGVFSLIGAEARMESVK